MTLTVRQSDHFPRRLNFSLIGLLLSCLSWLEIFLSGRLCRFMDNCLQIASCLFWNRVKAANIFSYRYWVKNLLLYMFIYLHLLALLLWLDAKNSYYYDRFQTCIIRASFLFQKYFIAGLNYHIENVVPSQSESVILIESTCE